VRTPKSKDAITLQPRHAALATELIMLPRRVGAFHLRQGHQPFAPRLKSHEEEAKAIKQSGDEVRARARRQRRTAPAQYRQRHALWSRCRASRRSSRIGGGELGAVAFGELL